MPYDEEVAARIRESLTTQPDVTEKRMFGGLAFVVGGHMAIAASSNGGALVRVDPADLDRLVDTTPAVPMVMRGRPMTGWLDVPATELRTARQVTRWVKIGLDCARSLPPN